MKILGLNANKIGCGTYYQTVYMMRELARRGNQVTMCTVSRDLKIRSREYTDSGVHVIEGPNFFYKFFSTGWNFLDLAQRFKLINREDYDIVYGTEYQPVVSWPVYLTKRKRKYKFISHWCDWYAGASNSFRGLKIAHRIDSWMEENIRFWADALLVNNSSLQKRALDIGVPREKVFYVPDGADVNIMRPYPQKGQRAEFDIPQDAFVLAMISEGSDSRPVDILFEVRKIFPDCFLLLLGQENQAAVVRAKELGIERYLIDPGYVPFEQLPKYLSTADVCFQVLTDSLCNRSRYPLKIGDYLSVGKATVISAVGDVAERFRQHEIGCLANADFDVKEFGGLISDLLSNEGKRTRMGRNARQLMVQQYNWETILSPYVDRILEFISR